MQITTRIESPLYTISKQKMVDEALDNFKEAYIRLVDTEPKVGIKIGEIIDQINLEMNI